MWEVSYLPGAVPELDAVPAKEQAAIRNAVEKLKALGPQLRYPHSSDVRGSDDLRELRPRQGRCPYRPLYTRVPDSFLIAAIGPDGESDPRGFNAACRRAEERLREWEKEKEKRPDDGQGT